MAISRRDFPLRGAIGAVALGGVTGLYASQIARASRARESVGAHAAWPERDRRLPQVRFNVRPEMTLLTLERA